MNGSDQQTFGRGVSASLLGLAIQALIAAVFGVLALWLKGEVLVVTTFQAIGGLALWLALAVVYQQHKLERIEALEADELAKRHGEQSSIFQTTADDLSVARRRVLRLHKWGLPIVSLFTSAYLIAMGAWLIKKALPLLAAPALVSDKLNVDPLLQQLIGGEGVARWPFVTVIAVAIAFVAFLVCRYLAGMAKLRDWSLLRGGAGYMMGTALVSLSLAAGYAALFFGSSFLLKYLSVILPGFMVVIGLEIIVNFVLDFYRPRRADQPHRAAFDSRVLSLLTSPESIARTINEAINYQFGFEVTRSWFWQLLSKAFGYLILLGAAVLIAVSSLILVAPNQQAVVTRFGRVVGQPLGPGLHFKLPWPIESDLRVDVTNTRQIVVGSLHSESDLKTDMPILWANEHYNVKPVYLMVAPPSGQDAAGGLSPSMTTGESTGTSVPADQTPKSEDTARPPPSAVVNAEVIIDYNVSDVMAYVTRAADPERQLQEIGNAEVTRYLFRGDIDAWIGADRTRMSSDLMHNIQAGADAAKLGLKIVNVSVASIHPPQPVAEAFQDVINAELERQTIVERAHRDAINKLVTVAGSTSQARQIVTEINKLEQIRSAGADAKAIAQQETKIEQLLFATRGYASQQLAEARADRWNVENSARSQALLYQPQLAAYDIAPRVYKLRAYLQAMTDGMATARKFVILADRKNLTTRFDLKELDTGFQNLNLNAKD